MIAFLSRLLCWLLFCASPFATNVLPSVTWAYDAQAQLSDLYDGGATSGFCYDSVSTPSANEKENRLAGTNAVFARPSDFLAAKTLPELEISASKYPELAENILNAQKAGHPDVLTHGGEAVIDVHRIAALHQPYRDFVPNIGRGLSRDEYPFASSLQGGGGAWVGHIPVSQQQAQGGLIRAMNLKPGDQYRVVVVP